MSTPRKRSILAWCTIGILAADVAQSAMRLALCSSLPEADQPSICRQPPVTVAVLAAKMRALLQVWSGLETLPVEPPPPLSPEGSQMERSATAPEF